MAICFTPMSLYFNATQSQARFYSHDVKNALLYDREDRGLLKKQDIFTYPSPRRLGIGIDADDQTKVQQVLAASAAAEAGLRRGDSIVSVAGQRVLTFADFTRVLELAPETGTLDVVTKRGGQTVNARIPLRKGWRADGDPSWRSSTSVVGPNSGFWANQLPPSGLRRFQLGEDDLSLKVVVVWGGWAKRAGIRNGDIVTKIDGLNRRMSIRQLQTHLQMHCDYGDSVKVTVLRNGKPRELTMTLPSQGERH